MFYHMKLHMILMIFCKNELFNTIEKYFSIFQTIKILDYMNLDYNIITSKNANKIKSMQIISKKLMYLDILF